jgi:hypothetical protein
MASITDAEATGEAISPQKRTSDTGKHDLSLLFPIFALVDPVPDPATLINADQYGSGTLRRKLATIRQC